MAGCCGTPTMAQAAVQGLIDKGVTSGAMVKLVYIGGDPTVRPYTVDGNVYMFGNTERRRVNAVAARVAPFFLSVQSPNYGKFALWDEGTYTAEGLPLKSIAPLGQGVLVPTQTPLGPGALGAEASPSAEGKKKRGA